MDDLFGKQFGNYLLHGIDEIVLPNSISWWPQTLGWKLLLLVLLALLIHRAYRWRLHRQRNRYRRIALAEIAKLQAQHGDDWRPVVVELPRLLKACALHAYPRDRVAALHGTEWLSFLDQQYKGPPFSSELGEVLLTVAYQSQSSWQLDTKQAQRLINQSRRWIRQHKPAESLTSSPLGNKPSVSRRMTRSAGFRRA